MTLKTIALVVGIIAGIPSTATVAVWAGDTRYVTQKSQTIKELNELKREERWLRIKEKNGEATQSEKYYREFLQQEIERIETELKK